MFRPATEYYVNKMQECIEQFTDIAKEFEYESIPFNTALYFSADIAVKHEMSKEDFVNLAQYFYETVLKGDEIIG
jgi:hypothetical protein